MKVYPLLRRNMSLGVLLFFICFAGALSSYAEQEQKSASFEQQMKSKTFEQWFKYYVPFFNPTEAQVNEKLRNDPNSPPYYHPESPSADTLGVGEVLQTSGEPAPKKMAGLPKDAYVAVVIPKGMSLPQESVNTQSAQNNAMPLTQQQATPLWPQSHEDEFSMSAPVNTNENLIRLPTPEKNYAGIWTGQYNKLIEYFDKASESWKASENSLRDVPVEINFNSNGQLSYKMPEREGSAAFSVRNGYLSIICPDVRVRGDYEVFQEDSTLLMRTSRVLVKDKMRVSLEFKLASKA